MSDDNGATERAATLDIVPARDDEVEATYVSSSDARINTQLEGEKS
jgi:hypothetical protein